MKLKVWKFDPKLSCTFFAPALILSRATPLHPQYHDYTPDDYEPEFFRSAPPGAFSQCFYTSTRVDLGAINYENDGSTLGGYEARRPLIWTRARLLLVYASTLHLSLVLTVHLFRSRTLQASHGWTRRSSVTTRTFAATTNRTKSKTRPIHVRNRFRW